MGMSEDLKGVSIVEQMRLALKLLHGYPKIEEIIDLEAARGFLEMLEGTQALYIPKFSEVDERKIKIIKKQLEGRREEWITAIRKLPLIKSYDVEVYDELEEMEIGDRKVIFEVSFPLDETEISEEVETTGRGIFCEYDYALISDSEGGYTLVVEKAPELELWGGSWAEAYIKLANHLYKLASKPRIPLFPKNLKKKFPK
jgi:hypothetical protein